MQSPEPSHQADFVERVKAGEAMIKEMFEDQCARIDLTIDTCLSAIPEGIRKTCFLDLVNWSDETAALPRGTKILEGASASTQRAPAADVRSPRRTSKLPGDAGRKQVEQVMEVVRKVFAELSQAQRSEVLAKLAAEQQ